MNEDNIDAHLNVHKARITRKPKTTKTGTSFIGLSSTQSVASNLPSDIGSESRSPIKNFSMKIDEKINCNANKGYNDLGETDTASVISNKTTLGFSNNTQTGLSLNLGLKSTKDISQIDPSENNDMNYQDSLFEENLVLSRSNSTYGPMKLLDLSGISNESSSPPNHQKLQKSGALVNPKIINPQSYMGFATPKVNNTNLSDSPSFNNIQPKTPIITGSHDFSRPQDDKPIVNSFASIKVKSTKSNNSENTTKNSKLNNRNSIFISPATNENSGSSPELIKKMSQSVNLGSNNSSGLKNDTLSMKNDSSNKGFKQNLTIEIHSTITSEFNSAVNSPKNVNEKIRPPNEKNETCIKSDTTQNIQSDPNLLSKDLSKMIPSTTKNFINPIKQTIFDQSGTNSDNEYIKNHFTTSTNIKNKNYVKDPSFLPKQNLIRKNKSNEQRINELMKNKDLYISEDEGHAYMQINGLIKKVEDPLEKFDKETLKLLSYLDINELEYSMPVTLNTNTQSYNIKITEIKLISEISRAYYIPLDETQQNFGKPKCICNTEEELIIGSSKGIIHIFDFYNQKLIMTLGTSKEIGYGAVTSVDIIDEKYLVSGYENGIIIIWDYVKKSLIKTLNDIHKTSIICLKIVRSQPLLFLSADAIGNVVMIEFEKVLLYNKVETNFIFSQSAQKNILDIRILNREVSGFKKLNILGDEQIIIAFATLTYIHFISLEPISKSIKTIYKFMKPNFIQEKAVPSITWCNNIFNIQENKYKNYILIGWGNSLSLLEFDSIGNITKLKSEGVIKMNFEIIFCTFIGHNLIFSIASKIDEKTNDIIHTIHIVHISEFKKTMILNNTINENIDDELTNKTSNNNNNNNTLDYEEGVVMYTEYLDKDYNILEQKYIKDIHTNSIYSTYNNSITMLNNRYEGIILGNKTIYILKIIKWKEYLDTLIQNSVWKIFFSLSLEILNHNIKEFGDIPDDNKQRRDILLPYFEKQLILYINTYLSNNNNNKMSRSSDINNPVAIEITKTIIDFCIEANMEYFLFNELKSLYMKYQMNELFIMTLEPFIKSNRLKILPLDKNNRINTNSQSLLREIISYYTSSKINKNDLMEQMLANLDINKNNIDDLVNICIEFNFYIALICICKKVNDYITPLIRFMGECSKSQREKNIENIQLCGSRCLWYIKMCFKRKILFYNEEIPFDEWKNVLNQISEVFMTEEYLTIFFNKLNPSYSINILAMIFEPPISEIIQKFSQYNKKTGYIGKINKIESNSHLINANIHFKILENLIHVLMNKAENETQRKKNRLYASFICAKIIQNIDINSIDLQFCLDAAEYIIKMHTEFDELIIINFKMMLIAPNYSKDKKTIDQIKFIQETLTEHYILEVKSNMILALVKYGSSLLTQNLETCKKMIKYLELSPFIEPLFYLLILQKEYKKAFDKILHKNTPPKIKTKAIDWTIDTMRRLQFENKKAFDEFSNCILEKIHDLITFMNPMQVNELIYKKFKNREQEIIYRLNNEPEVQLTFLEKLLQNKKVISMHNIDNEDNNNNNNNNNNTNTNTNDIELKELYIMLLCKSSNKIRRKSVLKELQEYEIYTNNCIKYCKQYNIKDALAYLEEKCEGIDGIKRAIQLKFEIFEDYFLKYLQKKNELSSKAQTKIKNKFHDAINSLICYKDNHKEIWLKFFVNSIALNNKIITEMMYITKTTTIHEENPKYFELKKLIEELIIELLPHVIKNTDIKTILMEIEKLSAISMIDRHVLKTHFRNMILDSQFENKLMNDLIRLTQCDLKDLINAKVLPQVTKPIQLKNICEICQKSLSSNSYTFACGHSFHINCCLNGSICSICEKSEDIVVTKYIIQKYNQKVSSTNKLNIESLNESKKIEIKDNIDVNIQNETKKYSSNRIKTLLKLIDEEKNCEIRSLFEYASQKILN